ncbi:hypothetical protein DSL72_003169 [Monilinia vaccinii-corymbosi]|uniref:Uncharacterized protein n=1 Tax=Monilinia vaccinii-corymbosi TaxID=61207 RepID=A0A8A3NX96_9HELO|nr:hypothetical protein DSL72_003169 [Monilinia vaccinii-corymbosi]
MPPVLRNMRKEVETEKGGATTRNEREKTEEHESDEGTMRSAKRSKKKHARDSGVEEDGKEKREESHALAQFTSFEYSKHERSLGIETWRSRLSKWIAEFKQKELAGVVWDEHVTPWKEDLREDREAAAKLCDFETPSEKAGLVLDCPVQEYPEEGVLNPELVELHVGPEKKVIRINKELISRKIDYFFIVFPGFVDVLESELASLNEREAKAFDDMIYWVSYGHLPPWTTDRVIQRSPPNSGTRDTSTVRMAFGFDFIALFAIADRLGAFTLMHLITDYVIGCTALDISVFQILDISDIYARIYTNAPQSLGLKRLACYIFSYCMESCPEASHPAAVFACLLQSVDGLALDMINLRRSQAGRPLVPPEDLDACYFHDHPKSEICDKKKFRERTPGLRRPQDRRPERVRFD